MKVAPPARVNVASPVVIVSSLPPICAASNDKRTRAVASYIGPIPTESCKRVPTSRLTAPPRRVASCRPSRLVAGGHPAIKQLELRWRPIRPANGHLGLRIAGEVAVNVLGVSRCGHVSIVTEEDPHRSHVVDVHLSEERKDIVFKRRGSLGVN